MAPDCCRLLAAAGEACEPPFTTGGTPGAQAECFATLQETPWTPTSEPCAVALARAYNVSDAPLRAAAASMTSLHDLCGSSTSQVRCPCQHTCCCPDGLIRLLLTSDVQAAITHSMPCRLHVWRWMARHNAQPSEQHGMRSPCREIFPRLDPNLQRL